jgi:hypothetical protein
MGSSVVSNLIPPLSSQPSLMLVAAWVQAFSSTRMPALNSTCQLV